ncbi:hypothetical protein AVEN_156700-1 [Araneus ventricosus]|uniref:Uncharacterized protein n=1 Tax=Araneus ventricosus TaxID=182803 RepID=A0A4Y2R3P2_ARAVE|nr:hypothetical protein AVEN_253284-1 [Araneus ventricosus]GBN70076.1 hypothetical protein AVEN_156700-1 [Araneus ventricosus]
MERKKSPPRRVVTKERRRDSLVCVRAMLFPIHNFFMRNLVEEGVTSGTSRIAIPLGASPAAAFPWRPGGSWEGRDESGAQNLPGREQISSLVSAAGHVMVLSRGEGPSEWCLPLARRR